ncbi:MAG: hypothetical protein A2Z16_05115 [Chloroflexi bacterium RBG_16_54_18]|nr:MAG: hypothetical protein A2Z16_05115 [Chloroflexi bacterium RBG_16_54_18]
MSEQLKLREFIVHVTQRWPILVVFCLAGSMLGWGISLLYPPTVRATTELYVGLNIENIQPNNNSESFAGPRFTNADDYKNWQMANLNALVYMDEILDETLSQLRAVDPYWNDINRRQLRKSLHVYWRNAGKWRLVAEGDDRLRVAQAVTLWQDVIVNRVHQAVTAAESLMSLEKEIDGLSLSLAQIAARKVELDYLNQTLLTRRESLLQNTSSETLNENDRWSIWQPAAQADLGAVWSSLSQAFPVSDALLQDYLFWIEQANIAIEQEIRSTDAQEKNLEKEKLELTNYFFQTSDTGLGLSENLEVEKITTDVPQFSTIRPTSTLILIGMVLGLLSWIGYWMVVYSLPSQKKID